MNFPPSIDVRRYQVNYPHKDDSNVNYEVFSSGDDLNPHYDEEFTYNQMQNRYIENPDEYPNIYNQSPSDEQEQIPESKH